MINNNNTYININNAFFHNNLCINCYRAKYLNKNQWTLNEELKFLEHSLFTYFRSASVQLANGHSISVLSPYGTYFQRTLNVVHQLTFLNINHVNIF